MAATDRQDEAAALMEDFAARTGLSTPAAQSQRYLWTDAFAVCNYLELFARTGEAAHRQRAAELIDQVHHVLGRWREEGPRRGWISGLDEAAGAARPTAGGLRIGKPLPERGPEEPFDEQLEWERDGQYFHYLTKWMHALARAAPALGEPAHLRWAVELAKVAWAGFRVDRGGEAAGLHWKMSTDLSRPLVPSASPHDSLDGFITFRVLDAAAGGNAAGLGEEIAALAPLCRGRDWGTADPLGLGGLLFDLFRLSRLPGRGRGGEGDPKLIDALIAGAAEGLRDLHRSRLLDAPPAYRLAFRELGLAIGLQALAAVERDLEPSGRSPGGSPDGPLAALVAQVPLSDKIAATWRDPARRATASWLDHRDINDVMLATALCPGGFLAT